MTDVRLPPLNGLRCFHAVMLQNSFGEAASHLRVTPQAVSHQIRALEDHLGVSLFHRRGRSVIPTEEALLLHRHVAAGFEEFGEGVRRLTDRKRARRIALNVSPYFATRCLLPRLGEVRALLPDTDIRLTQAIETPPLDEGGVDLAIQWRFVPPDRDEARLLLKDPKLICCVPALADRIRAPEDLPRAVLLHPVLAKDYWRRICAYLGVAAGDLSNSVELHDAAVMHKATLLGLGVGLLSVDDAVPDLRAGRLVAPLGEDALTGMAEAEVPGFWLLVPRAKRRDRAVAKLADWLNAQDWN